MKSKLQSAMEYLMTYGWAILVIAVVLGVLYSLGIFSPSNFAPKAQPGSCQVFRPNGPGTNYDINLEGTCSGELPEYAAQFDGKSSYINAGESSLLQSNTFTITAWVNPATLDLSGNAITGSSSPSGVEFRLANSGGKLYLQALKEDITGIGTSTGYVSAGTWSFVAVTYNSSANGAYAYYVNGANAGSGNNLQTFSWSSQYIGKQSSNTEYFNGMLSNVQIYNVSLSGNDVAALYAEGIGGTPTDLRHICGWWPLNGNANDYSGNNNDGIPTNIIYKNT